MFYKNFYKKYFNILFLILFLIFHQNRSYSQDSSSVKKSLDEILISDILISIKNTGSYFTQPLRFDGTDWLMAAGLTGATVLMITSDESITNKVGRTSTRYFNDTFWDVITEYGSIEYANVFAASLYTAGWLSGEESIRVTGRLLLESLSFSGLTVLITRYVAGRVRPVYNEGAWAFRGFRIDNEFQSFPSGHSVVAFSLATVLSERFNNICASIGLYGLATVTSLLRIYNHEHFFSDVILSGLLGVGTGLFVINRENERMNGVNHSQKIFIYPSNNGIGLAIPF